MSLQQLGLVVNEREIIQYFLKNGATCPAKAISTSKLINDNVNILSQAFKQLAFYGVVRKLEKADKFYLDLENLKRYRNYLFIHTFSYSSFLAVLVLLGLILFTGSFSLELFLIAIAIGIVMILPPSLYYYNRYNFEELKKLKKKKPEKSEARVRKTKESNDDVG